MQISKVLFIIILISPLITIKPEQVNPLEECFEMNVCDYHKCLLNKLDIRNEQLKLKYENKYKECIENKTPPKNPNVFEQRL